MVPQSAVSGVIGLAGPYDFLPLETPSTRTIFGQVEDLATTQPVNHARGDAPPLFLLTGSDDTVVRPRNSHALAARVKQAGGEVFMREYPGLGHADPLLHLAAPWRNRHPAIRNDILAILSGKITASVPVHDETR